MFELLHDAEVYAPRALGRVHVLVCADRIAWVGRDVPSLSRELGVRETDLGGLRLVPGFVDGHVHLTGGGGEAGPRSRVPPLAPSSLTIGGTTTAIGVLGTDDVTRDTGSLLVTARALWEEGLSAWCHTGGYHLPPVTLTGSVRRDIVHLDLVIGVGEVAISDHRSSQPTLDELLRLGSDAHVAGLMTGKAGIVHLHVGDGPRGLGLVHQALDTSEVPPRVWNPTHVNRRRALFDEALELTGRGCTIDVTAFPVAEDEDAWSAAAAIGRAFAAGVDPDRLSVSSDGGGCLPVFDSDGRVGHFDVGRPSSLAETLREVLASGVDLERALAPFTTTPARLLRLTRKGHIAAGADADLVTLRADGTVCDVMARGRWHVRDAVPVIRGVFETGRNIS